MTIRYDPESDKRKIARLQREVMGRNIQSPVARTKVNPRSRMNLTTKSNPSANPVVKKILEYGKANTANVQAASATREAQKSAIKSAIVARQITPSSTFITGKPAVSSRANANAARSALRSTILKTGK